MAPVTAVPIPMSMPMPVPIPTSMVPPVPVVPPVTAVIPNFLCTGLYLGLHGECCGGDRSSLSGQPQQRTESNRKRNRIFFHEHYPMSVTPFLSHSKYIPLIGRIQLDPMVMLLSFPALLDGIGKKSANMNMLHAMKAPVRARAPGCWGCRVRERLSRR